MKSSSDVAHQEIQINKEVNDLFDDITKEMQRATQIQEKLNDIRILISKIHKGAIECLSEINKLTTQKVNPSEIMKYPELDRKIGSVRNYCELLSAEEGKAKNLVIPSIDTLLKKVQKAQKELLELTSRIESINVPANEKSERAEMRAQFLNRLQRTSHLIQSLQSSMDELKRSIDRSIESKAALPTEIANCKTNANKFFQQLRGLRAEQQQAASRSRSGAGT